MECERCRGTIPEGEEREMHERVLCEDCYLDLLSPLKACDPWAVHSAKMLEREQVHTVDLTGAQQKILTLLKGRDGIEPGKLAEELGIKETDLERELAVLRHMEKVRSELRQGIKVIRLW